MSNTAVPVQVESGTGDVTVTSDRGVLVGWSLRESAGAPSTAGVTIRDGADTGPILAVVPAFTASSVSTVHFGEGGVRFNTGLFIERTSGETEGTVYVR